MDFTCLLVETGVISKGQCESSHNDDKRFQHSGSKDSMWDFPSSCLVLRYPAANHLAPEQKALSRLHGVF